MPKPHPCQRFVLFDFDGTLADSIPDLWHAANHIRAQQGLAPMPIESFRPHVSGGCKTMLGAALGLSPEDTDYLPAQKAFLAHYEAHLYDHLALFDPIPELLDQLDAEGIAWGVVTNKRKQFAYPIFRHLGLWTRSKALVAGDTVSYAKPHPLPLWHAARLLGCEGAHGIFVGDDERDVQAGKAAGMRTLVAGYGYCAPQATRTWGADAIVDQPQDLWSQLQALWNTSAA